MISLVKKWVFSGKTKSATGPHIFLVLCFYAAFTAVYAYVVVDTETMLFRLGTGALIVACFVICERAKISHAAAAFVSPAFIMTVIIFSAVYLGDVLVFIYLVGGAMFSLTYLKPKSILLYLGYNSVLLSVILFGFKVNLLGGAYSLVHNGIFFVTAIALGILVYLFCVSYVKTINSLVEAESKAALAAKAKGNFLARMSHEIRTPLNAIVGLTEIQLRKDLPADQQQAMTKIRSSGTLLLGIINDILDLSKIESGKFDLVVEPYNTADVLSDIINLNMVRIGDKPIQFFVEISPTVPRRLSGDSLRIKQLLSNLLSNAFKYTKRGSVRLALDWEQTDDGRAELCFSVSDTGIGMSEDDLERLFSEYSQFNRRANKAVEGTGLGLSICKWLTGLMDGSISATSQPDKGSVFVARIMQDIATAVPLGQKTADALADFNYSPEETGAEIEFVQMPAARVLVVDDVELNLMVASALLEPYGMTVDCLSSGSAAVDRLREGLPQYDLIFMDHMMPGMDGIEAVAAIRALDSDYAKTVPIVALTANATSGSEKMFIESGFQGFVAKPIDTAKLDNVIKKWIQKA